MAHLSPTWERVVLDFDGTLAHRPGRWSQAVLDVLDARMPRHTATLDAVREALRGGFPWHFPDVAHPELGASEAWWGHVGRLLGSAFEAAGAERAHVPDLVAAARAHYCDPARFLLYDDTVDALRRLADAGVDAVILSNHVPELPAIVAGLGLDELVGRVVSSAAIGYEKPHVGAFRHVLHGAIPGRCWMIGDNPTADVDGGRAAGMHARLVRHPDAGGRSVGDVVDELLAAT